MSCLNEQALTEETSHRPVLSVRNVTRVFNPGEPREVTALNDISFDVYEGEMIAIVGPSGSGKSTLLNILGLLDSPTSGRYHLTGRNVTGLSETELDEARVDLLGFVFQESYMLADLDVAENVALGLRAQATPLRACVKPVQDTAARVGLAHRISTPTALLSGGERQRAALARALATRPAVLLADEPTGNLDRANGDAVLRMLADLRTDKTAVVVITHDDRVAAAADRRLRIEDGRLLETGNLLRTVVPQAQRTISPRRHRQWPGAIRDAVNTVLLRPWRALALVLAFALGSAGFLAAFTLSETASAQVATLITTAGLDEVRVGSPTKAVDPQWVDSLRRLDHVRGIGATGRLSGSDYPVTRFHPDLVRGMRPFDTVAVADAGFLAISEGIVRPASALTLFSRPQTSNAVIVGDRAAEAFGLSENLSGSQTIWVLNREYDVLGTIRDSPRDTSLGDKVFLPESAGIATSLMYVVRTDPGYPAVLADAIPLALNPGNPGAVTVNTVADLRDLRRGVANDMGTLVGVLSIVLIAMATLGAGATMSASVRARSAQIALRRAVGWSRRSIRTMFLSEGILLGVLGGLLGSAIGLLTTMAVCAVLGWVPHISMLGILIAVGAGPLSGAVAAFVPAVHAANLKPAIALKTG